MADALNNVIINEVHFDPSGAGQDYDGSGVANGNDRLIEFHNTSGSAVNLNGWQIHTYPPGSNGSLKHTFGSSDEIPADGYFTIVDSNGSGNTLTGVGSPAAFSDQPGLGLGVDKTLILYNPAAGQFIALGGPEIGSFLSTDIDDFATDFGATVVGSGEVAVDGSAGQSWQRETDGSDTFVAGTPSPGAVNCFAEGTRISTPGGMAPVENLNVGDTILTDTGCAIAVKWVGRQTVSARFGPAERLMPIRVRAGALGDGVPLRDLTLTADHALLIDGLLVNASALVNGTTIINVPLSEFGECYVVYHVETEDHAIILAEGTPAETFIDNVTRETFDNYAEFETLYGSTPPLIAEMDAPRVMSRRQLPARLRAFIGLPHAA